MTRRNLNPYTYFERAAVGHQPTHRFTGRTRAQFQSWQRRTKSKVIATLGSRPDTVNLKPQLLVEWEEGGLIKQRWIIDVRPNLSATLLLYRPANLKRGQKRPAILCCHGHGSYGKDSVMGIASTDARSQEIATNNYAYGLAMAKAGFVTYAIDWLGFGERDSRAKPYYYNGMHGSDPCNVHFLCATMLGTTVLAGNCHDAARATDFVATRSYVDSRRLGVMGLSLGGTMTTWMMNYDRRFTAAEIICYAGPFYTIAYETYNVCGSQVTPGLYELVDVADLQGLIAPRPMLVAAAVHDKCFEIDFVMGDHYKQLERIYHAAGAADRLELDLYPTEHGWGGKKSASFFGRWLKADWL